jgi:hypothetical protein
MEVMMKQLFLLALSVFLFSGLGLRAQALRSNTELAKLDLAQLQAYLAELDEADFNQAIASAVASNEPRFIKFMLIAAQNILNAKPAAERQKAVQSLVAAVPLLNGMLLSNGKTQLVLQPGKMKSGRIGAELQTASKAARQK